MLQLHWRITERPKSPRSDPSSSGFRCAEHECPRSSLRRRVTFRAILAVVPLCARAARKWSFRFGLLAGFRCSLDERPLWSGWLFAASRAKAGKGGVSRPLFSCPSRIQNMTKRPPKGLLIFQGNILISVTVKPMLRRLVLAAAPVARLGAKRRACPVSRRSAGGRTGQTPAARKKEAPRASRGQLTFAAEGKGSVREAKKENYNNPMAK